MKELSIEEKAKRYDKAIKVAQRFYNNSVAVTKKGLEDIFPELKESEDERIRKAIKKALQVRCDGSRIISDEPVTLEEAIAWLEKQGEQNPTWSEEDEKCIENAIMYCEWARDIAPNLHCYEISEKSINWLKSLKDRVLPQPKQEWSKEDKVMLDEIIDFFENGTVKLQHDLSLYASWLKSIRPQSTWKPSKEQIEALNRAMYHVEDDVATQIAKLIGDLKKLRDK